MELMKFKSICNHCPLYRDGACKDPSRCNYKIHHQCVDNYLCADMDCLLGHGIGPKKRKYITDIYYTYCRKDEVDSDHLCRFDFMCTKGDRCPYEHTLVDKKHRYTISNILNAVDDDEAYDLYDRYYLRFQKRSDLYPGSRRNMMFMKPSDDASSASAKSTKKASESSCDSENSNSNVSYVEKVNATVKTVKLWSDIVEENEEDEKKKYDEEYPPLVVSTTHEVVVKKEIYMKDVKLSTSNRFDKLDVDDDVEVDSCEEEEPEPKPECTAVIPSPNMTHMDTALSSAERVELESLRKMKDEFEGFKNDMKQLLAMKQMFEQMAKMMK